MKYIVALLLKASVLASANKRNSKYLTSSGKTWFQMYVNTLILALLFWGDRRERISRSLLYVYVYNNKATVLRTASNLFPVNGYHSFTGTWVLESVH